MTIGTAIFFISAAVSALICFVLVKLRIGDIRDNRMQAFLPLCIAAIGWILMNAAVIIVEPTDFAAFYTARMTFACMIPYLNCWFFLNFSESKLVKSRLLRYYFITVCAADILAVLTNPLHHMYFVSYSYPFPERGIFAAFHVVSLSVVMVLAYAVLFPYIAKNLRRYPLLLLTGFGAITPYVLYLLYALQLVDSRYDFSPLGFFFSVILFAYFSYASRMAYSRHDALSGALDGMMQSEALSEGIVEDAAKIIAEKGCLALYASRIGIWSMEGSICKNISTFSLSTKEHTVQDDFYLSDKCGKSMDFLASQRLIVINDARPNVLADICGRYSSKICALLDAPIRIGGKLAGVVRVEQDCCEAYPERREWMVEEQSFVSSLADFMEIVMISGEHRTLAVRNNEIMANMPGAIYRCLNNPPKYTVAFVSQGIHAMTGYRPEELVGGSMAKLFKLLHPDDARQSLKLRGETLRRGQPLETYYRVIHKNDEKKWIWERSRVVKTAPDGRPQLFEGFCMDITEQRRREAAEAANEAKSVFLAHISHEMRTPLNAVLGLSELLLDGGGLNAGTAAYLDKIHYAGSTLLSIVNDILDVSKIEAGKFELIPQEYDVSSMINDAVNQNILRINSKPIHFTLDIDDNTPARLFGDELRVKQIINNLLSNAFKYTDQGTVELRLDCEREGNSVWMTFRVSDSGIGIRQEDMCRLFTDYTRFDETINRKTGGTGLGLSITKRLTEMMDGSVSARSEFGKGSLFTVRLRQGYVNNSVIGRELAEHLRNFSYSVNRRYSGSQLKRASVPYARILIVDDNITNLDIARGLMKPYGMVIDCVTGGQAAIDAIRDEKNKYSAVFMDHMMPGIDGIEATRIIREEIGSEYAKTVPIIALTANAVAGSKEQFISKGFNAFVSKPIDVFRLDEVIRRWIWDEEQDLIINPPEPAAVRADGNGFNGDNRNFSDSKFMENTDMLDWSKGVELFGGGESYRQVLRSFAVNTKPLLESISEVNKDTLAQYAITVHGIKSSGRGICAVKVGDMAESLELAAKAGNIDFVSRSNGDFLELTGKLIGHIEKLLDTTETAGTKPQKDRPDEAELKRLCAACEDYNMDEIEAVMCEIKKYEYSADNGLVDWLSDNIAQLNYTQVKEKIKNYKFR